MNTTDQCMPTDQQNRKTRTKLLAAFKKCKAPEQFIHNWLEFLEDGLNDAPSEQRLCNALKNTFHVLEDLHENAADDSTKLFLSNLQYLWQTDIV